MDWRSCDLLLSLAVFTLAISTAALQTVSPAQSYVATGGNISLTCLLDPQDSSASVRWSRGKPGTLLELSDDDSRLVASKSELFIGSFDAAEHAGSYSCVVTPSEELPGLLSCPALIDHARMEEGFDVHPEDTVTNEEGTAVLRCSPSHSVPPATITWTRNGQGLNFTSSAQLSILPSGNLYITNAMPSDAGVYQCTATNPVTGTMQHSNLATLTVLVGEDLTDTTPTFAVEPSNVTALEGSRVVIECAGRGNPQPLENWSRANGELPRGASIDTTGALVLENVSPSHAGIYICQLRYDNQTLIAKREITLSIQVAPAFTVTPSHQMLIHSTETISCSATASDPLQLYLLFNGTVLATDSGLEATVEVTLSPPPSPALPSIHTYQCLAINPAGCINFITMVTFHDPNITPTEAVTTPISDIETTPPLLVPDDESGSGIFDLTTTSEAPPTTTLTLITSDSTAPTTPLSMTTTDHVTFTTDHMITTLGETTQTTVSPLPHPTSLRARFNPQMNSIDVTWSYPLASELDIYGYKLNWDSPHRITASAREVLRTSDEVSSTYMFNINEGRFSELLPGVIVVYVWAFSQQGDGPFAQVEVEFSDITPESPTTQPEPAVLDCRAKAVSPTSIRLQLPDELHVSLPSPAILLAGCESAGSWLSMPLPMPLPSPHLLSNLLPNCSYAIRITTLDTRLAECRVSTPGGQVDINAMVERFKNGSILLTWTIPPEIRGSDRLVEEVNWGQGWIQITSGLHSPVNFEPDREYEVQLRLRHGEWEGVANVTVPRAPTVEVEEGDSPAEVAVLYIVIFGCIVVVCAVLLTIILGLKYVQGERRDSDKVTDFREKSKEKYFERMSFNRASIKSKSTDV